MLPSAVVRAAVHLGRPASRPGPGPDGGVPADGAAPSPREDGLTRRRTLTGAAALVLAGITAGPAAAAGPRRPGAPATGASPAARPAAGVLAAQVVADDLVVGSEARPRTLHVPSSGAGGTERGPGLYDSTGRVVLESHQAHFQHFGEVLRIRLKDARAKGMIAYQAAWPTPHYPDGDFTWRRDHPTGPLTVAWIGAHFLDNDNPHDPASNRAHGHINFEVPDSGGALRTRLEIKFIDPVTGRIGTDKSAIRTNMADFEFRAGPRGEQMRLVGNDTRDKDLVFATEAGAGQPRWVVRGTRSDAHLEFRRYLSDNRYQDSPLHLDRVTGRVRVGGAQGTSAGLEVVQRGGVGITVRPLAPGGQGVLVAGAPGDATARLVQGDVTGDTARRFVLQVDGTMQWGPGGSSERDTNLFRTAPGTLRTNHSVVVDQGLSVGRRSAPDAASLHVETPGGRRAVVARATADGTATVPVVAVETASPAKRAVDVRVTGDAVSRLRVDGDGRIVLGDGRAADVVLYRRGQRQLGTNGSIVMENSTTPPAPADGGVLFVQDGALKFRGSKGTVTTIAPA